MKRVECSSHPQMQESLIAGWREGFKVDDCCRSSHGYVFAMLPKVTRYTSEVLGTHI